MQDDIGIEGPIRSNSSRPRISYNFSEENVPSELSKEQKIIGKELDFDKFEFLDDDSECDSEPWL